MTSFPSIICSHYWFPYWEGHYYFECGLMWLDDYFTNMGSLKRDNILKGDRTSGRWINKYAFVRCSYLNWNVNVKTTRVECLLVESILEPFSFYFDFPTQFVSRCSQTCPITDTKLGKRCSWCFTAISLSTDRRF